MQSRASVGVLALCRDPLCLFPGLRASYPKISDGAALSLCCALRGGDQLYHLWGTLRGLRMYSCVNHRLRYC